MKFLIPLILLAGLSFSIELKSEAFKYGEYIPKVYTCEGKDVSPPLSWGSFPKETKSFAIIMEDPDAPGGTFYHWVVWNISPSITNLPENASKTMSLTQGINDFGKIGYGGPCPPPGKAHHYYIEIFALNRDINLPPSAKAIDLLKAIRGHIIGNATLMGLYKR